MSQVEELEREIKNAVDVMYGNPSEEATKQEEKEERSSDVTVKEGDAEVSLETTVNENQESTKVITQEGNDDKDTDSDEASQQKQQRTNWKKRYIGYKTSTDSTIHNLRQDVVALNDTNLGLTRRVGELSKEMAELKNANTDSFKDLFTEEERDIVGDQTITSVQKATRAAVDAAMAPLQAELAQVQNARIAEQSRLNEQERSNLKGEFLTKLGAVVPGYQELDTDPQFIKWMDEIDPMSGMTKKSIFLQSRDLGDVGRVAGFFNEYKAIRDGRGSEILEDSITPSKSSATVQTKEQPKKSNKILESVAMQFYDDCARGLYKGREALRVKYKEQIDTAIASGNIVAGR